MLQQYIDPKFSVYGLTKRSMRDVSVLNGRRTMEIISNEIENTTLIDGANTVLFAGFQRMSRFKPQMRRYRKLAEQSKHVYVFGEMDVEMPTIKNLTYVPLKPTDQLAKEWFLVSYGAEYFTALATEELTHIDDPDSKRKFRGFWTFDIAMVSLLYDWLSQAVNMRGFANPRDTANHQRQAQLLSNIMGRMTVRTMRTAEDDTISKEIKHIMEDGLYPVFKYLEEVKSQPMR